MGTTNAMPMMLPLLHN